MAGGNNPQITFSGSWTTGCTRKISADGAAGGKYIMWCYNNDPAGTNICDNASIRLSVNSKENLFLKNDGKVGIGTSATESILNIKNNRANTGDNAFYFETYNTNAGYRSSLQLKKSILTPLVIL